jgi:pyruvate/2-oxoglutarate dehydrogenase complex dihydrolipoamide acyltransferase (E2) component
VTEQGTPYPIVVPDLEIPDVVVTLSVWLVPRGARVTCGDRVVELLAGDATVDLSAPVDGILDQTCAVEDDRLAPGQVVGLILHSDD